MITYSLVFLLQIFGLVRPTRSIVLAKEVLCDGFDLAVFFPSDRRGSKTHMYRCY